MIDVSIIHRGVVHLAGKGRAPPMVDEGLMLHTGAQLGGEAHPSSRMDEPSMERGRALHRWWVSPPRMVDEPLPSRGLTHPEEEGRGSRPVYSVDASCGTGHVVVRTA